VTRYGRGKEMGERSSKRRSRRPEVNVEVKPLGMIYRIRRSIKSVKNESRTKLLARISR